MGRKPMPVDLLVLKGKKNLTKKEIEQRKQAEQAIKPKQDKIECPDWLDETAEAEWDRIVKDLMELNLLTNIDVSALSIYCDAYSKYVQATESLKSEGLIVEYTNKSGATNKTQNPNVQIANKYAAIVKSMISEFGLSPSARIKLVLPKEEVKEKSKEEKLFGDRL